MALTCREGRGSGTKGPPDRMGLPHTHLSERPLPHATGSRGGVDLFALVPALELRFEPELAELDRLLETISYLSTSRRISVNAGDTRRSPVGHRRRWRWSCACS